MAPGLVFLFPWMAASGTDDPGVGTDAGSRE